MQEKEINAENTRELKHLKLLVGYNIFWRGWLESKSSMSNSHQVAFVGNYPTPYRDGIRGEWMQECVYAVGRGASEGLVITSLVTPHHWKVNSAGIPKWCAIRTVMTWCSSGTACPWYPRAFGNTACMSALLLTSSHSAHVSVFALVHLRTSLPYFGPRQLQASQ